MAAGGTPLGFAEFYRREYPGVVRLGFALSGRYELAEEVAQDAFLAAERHWGRVGSLDNPGAWVRRVAVNRAISHYRKVKSELVALARLARRGTDPVTLAEPDTEVWAAVRSLPRRQAQVLALMFIEDRSPSEVALLLGCSEETVRTHARRGRHSLRGLLGSGAGKES